MRSPSPARKGLGLFALVVFVGMQPCFACGIHCTFLAPLHGSTGGMDMGAHDALCHPVLSLVNGHMPAVPNVATAPPAARARIQLSQPTIRFPAAGPVLAERSAFPDVESPPPRG